MKKNSFKNIVLSFIYLALIVSPAFGNYATAPQWSEFCPADYVDYTPKDPNTVKGIRANISYFFSYDSTGEYWYQRRVDFYKNLSNCSIINNSTNKEKCFLSVRTAEKNKNQILKEKEKQIAEEAKQAEEERKAQELVNLQRRELEIRKKELEIREHNVRYNNNFTQYNSNNRQMHCSPDFNGGFNCN